MQLLRVVSISLVGVALAAPWSMAADGAIPVSYDADGVTIHGDLFLPASPGDQAPVVILLHAAQSDRSVWREWIPALQRVGCAALAIDLRGHGASSGPAERDLPARAAKEDRRLYKSMHRDVAGAFEWLAQRPEIDLSRIVLIGTGLGGHVALDYAARDRSIDGVVMLAPAADGCGLNSEDDVTELGARPVFVVTSDAARSAVAEPLVAAGEAVRAVVDSAADVAGATGLSQAPQLAQQALAFVESSVGDATEATVFASVTSDVYHDPASAAARRIKPHNLRRFSNAAEAESRGLRAARGSGAASGDGGT